MSSQTFAITLEAGVDYVLNVTGQTFRIMEATGPVLVGVGDSPVTAQHAAGTGERLLTEFRKLRLRSDTAQEIVLLVGSGDLLDSRLSIPDGVTVDVIDRGAAASRNGTAFTAYANLAAITSKQRYFLLPGLSVAQGVEFHVTGIRSGLLGSQIVHSYAMIDDPALGGSSVFLRHRNGDTLDLSSAYFGITTDTDNAPGLAATIAAAMAGQILAYWDTVETKFDAPFIVTPGKAFAVATAVSGSLNIALDIEVHPYAG